MRYYKLYRYIDENTLNLSFGMPIKTKYLNHIITKEIDGEIVGLKRYSESIKEETYSVKTIRVVKHEGNKDITIPRNDILESEWFTDKNTYKNKVKSYFYKEMFDNEIERIKSGDAEFIDTFERVNDVLNYIELEKLIS